MNLLRTLCLLLLCGFTARAVTYTNVVNPPGMVMLAWDNSPDAGVTNYYVYWGVSSRTYTNRMASGGTNYILIPNLVRGTTYYFAATAVAMDTYGQGVVLESPFSAEVTFTPRAIPPPPTLRVTNQLVAVNLQSAPSVNGPWTAYASLGTDALPSPTFFRVAIAAPPLEPPQIKPLFRSPKRNAT